MKFGSFRYRYKSYRRWNRWWPHRAAWYAITEDARATVVLLAVLAMLIFHKCPIAHAQIGDLPTFGSPFPADPAPVQMGYYIQLQPQVNGPIGLVGPWCSLAAARDVLGSALYSHPFICHITGPHPPANCRITGNGFAYPAGTPYPPPHQIPSSDVVQLPLAGNPDQHGWMGLYYANDGTVTVFPAKDRPIYRAKVQAGLGAFPLYVNKACPGWPNILVGYGGNGQGDGACN